MLSYGGPHTQVTRQQFGDADAGRLQALIRHLATLNLQPPGSWLQEYAAAVQQRAGDLDACQTKAILQHLAAFAPALAGDLRDKLLVRQISSAVQSACSISEVAAAVNRYSSYLGPAALSALMLKVAATGKGYSPGDQARTVVCWKPGAVETARALSLLAKRQLPNFDAIDTSAMLQAIAKLGFYDEGLVGGLLSLAQSRFESLTAQQLVAVLRGVVALRLDPGPRWWQLWLYNSGQCSSIAVFPPRLASNAFDVI